MHEVFGDKYNSSSIAYTQGINKKYDYSNYWSLIFTEVKMRSYKSNEEILKEDLEHCMRLPMTDKVRSLNLSNCAAICIYEVLRQQDYRDLLRDEPFKGIDYLEK